MHRTVVIMCLLAVLVTPRLSAETAYQPLMIAGWQVLLDEGCRQGAEEERRAFDVVLAEQIARLGRLPVAARERLRQAVRIYVSSATYRKFGAQHHPSAEWLGQNGYPREMAGHVEICNWREFTGLVRNQPFCLLHEMAHAFHHLTPASDAEIRTAYERAKAAGLYRKVTRGRGKELVEAYALSTRQEYFAELSEAYFGENDFAPYDRAELRAYDQDGLRLIERVWGVTADGVAP
ncbi:MAG: hypothetical protein H0W78_19145 [Planctomycetes bacterium]|nr:hypothetical protein [Planctomycetota bacterium]